VPGLEKAGYAILGVLKQGIYLSPRKTAALHHTLFQLRHKPRHRCSLWTNRRYGGRAGLAILPDGKELLYAQIDHALTRSC